MVFELHLTHKQYSNAYRKKRRRQKQHIHKTYYNYNEIEEVFTDICNYLIKKKTEKKSKHFIFAFFFFRFFRTSLCSEPQTTMSF